MNTSRNTTTTLKEVLGYLMDHWMSRRQRKQAKSWVRYNCQATDYFRQSHKSHVIGFNGCFETERCVSRLGSDRIQQKKGLYIWMKLIGQKLYSGNFYLYIPLVFQCFQEHFVPQYFFPPTRQLSFITWHLWIREGEGYHLFLPRH